MTRILIDGNRTQASSGERQLDVINRSGHKLSQVCYHPQLGPIQICETCIVEVDGKLVRARATAVEENMKVSTTVASRAQRRYPGI